MSLWDAWVGVFILFSIQSKLSVQKEFDELMSVFSCIEPELKWR